MRYVYTCPLCGDRHYRRPDTSTSPGFCDSCRKAGDKARWALWIGLAVALVELVRATAECAKAFR